MQPTSPTRNYQYHDFINFNINSNFSNIPREQICYILSDIANEIVAKADANLARAFVCNTLFYNSWYNQEFYTVATDIIAIIAGRLAPGVSISCISNSIISEYMACYTGYQVMINQQLSVNLPANQVAASQQNATHYRELKEEANRVNQMTNQQQVHPQQQQPMMPQQGMMYPQQGMMYPQQPMGYPQQPMGYPQQPMGYPQQPMGFPQQPMGFPQQPMGYPQQMPIQNFAQNRQQFNYNQVSQATNKFSNSDVYTQSEPVNSFSMNKPERQYSQASQEVPMTPIKDEPMKPIILNKRDDKSNYVEINNTKINLDYILGQSFTNDVSNTKYYNPNVIITGSLKEAVHSTHCNQIKEQSNNYINNIYGSAVSIITEYAYINDMSDVVNECIIAAESYEDFCGRLNKFYSIIENFADNIKPENRAINTVEAYEKFRFMNNIDKQMVDAVNSKLNNEMNLTVKIETMSTDAIELFNWLSDKHGINIAQRYRSFVENLFTSVKEKYNQSSKELFTQYTEETDCKYTTINIYVGNLNIDNSSYTFDNGSYFEVSEEATELKSSINLFYQHASNKHIAFEMYVTTLDGDVYRVYKKDNDGYIMKKIFVI